MNEFFFKKTIYTDNDHSSTTQSNKLLIHVTTRMKILYRAKETQRLGYIFWFHLNKTLKSLIDSTVIENRAVIVSGKREWRRNIVGGGGVVRQVLLGGPGKYYLAFRGSISMKFLAWGKYIGPCDGIYMGLHNSRM